jgi:hypothetical protein
MATEGSLYVRECSAVRSFVEAVSWLWRLGPILDSPRAGAVGIGSLEDAEELYDLLRADRLGGAVVFAARPGPDIGPVPPRQRVQGVADFGPGRRVAGPFCVLHGATPVVSSSLGAHAVRDGALLAVAADPVAAWGGLDAFWVWQALADFLVEALERPLVMLPPVGWIRYDDVPGNGYQQLAGHAKPDRRFRARIERLVERYGEVGAKLNVAVAARAYADEKEVGVEEVWPESVAALRSGIEGGVLELVCHGYLHVDTEALAGGRLEPREFTRLDAQESGRRIDAAIAWARDALGVAPSTFVAPTWGYGPGLVAALSERGLPAWLPPEPGPLLRNGNAHETLLSTLEGLQRLDFGCFEALASAGVPPTLVIHGGLFDGRLQSLRFPRDAAAMARLAVRRDLFRVPWTPGVRWIGASDLLDLLRAHDRIEVEGDDVRVPAGAEAIVRGRGGVTTMIG